jgi:hypothetical protein
MDCVGEQSRCVFLRVCLDTSTIKIPVFLKEKQARYVVFLYRWRRRYEAQKKKKRRETGFDGSTLVFLFLVVEEERNQLTVI